MSDSNQPASGMFSEPPKEKSFPTTAVSIAGVAIVILVAFLVLMGRRKGGPEAAPNTLQPLAAYASSLSLSGIQMSEADVPSGGKQTYIDGHITNQGSSTVTGVTVQAIFTNDEAMPPQIQTTPLTLVRMREPYIDTEPVSAAPLAPGGGADFHLIFEGVVSNWNQQTPEIHVVRVTTK